MQKVVDVTSSRATTWWRRGRLCLPQRKFALDIVMMASVVLIFVASAFYASDTVRRLLDRDAEWTAKGWAMTLSGQLSPDGGLLTTGRPTPTEARIIAAAIGAGEVFRLKMFDRVGRLSYTSDEGMAPEGGTSLYDHQPHIAQALLAGEIHVEAADGRAKPNRPDDYAEAYVPILIEGEMRGIMEVYVDQTEKRTLFAKKLRVMTNLIIVLGVIALLHLAYTAWLVRRQVSSDAQVHRLAHYDDLTSLPNRTTFQNRLRKLVNGQRGGDASFAVHMMDLDGFKAINDTMGHDAGDDVLRRFASAVARLTRDDDTFARQGGDEFALIQTGVSTSESAVALAKRIEDAARDITDVGGVPIVLSVSVGIVLSSTPADGPDEVMKCADIALYEAKNAGKNRTVVFEPGMDETHRQRNRLRARLKTAVEDGDLVLHFQPLHGSDDDEVCSFEALVRLRGDDGALVPPAAFIPLAEEMDLTGKLGRWVLNEACRVATEWPDGVRVSVNLSPQQFEGDVVGDVLRALSASGLTPNRLEVEITESLFINDPEHVQAQLHRLRDHGVRVVMDDFGTGYSSLSYLWMFPFDKLKVDRSCFMSLGEDETVAEVLRTISIMSRAMKLSVTAEGIETDAQRAFARTAGYDEMQGFLYGRPMPREEIARHFLETAAKRLHGQTPLADGEAEVATG